MNMIELQYDSLVRPQSSRLNVRKRRHRAQTCEDYQVGGRFPVFAACGQVAGLITACTELLYRRRREHT